MRDARLPARMAPRGGFYRRGLRFQTVALRGLLRDTSVEIREALSRPRAEAVELAHDGRVEGQDDSCRGMRRNRRVQSCRIGAIADRTAGAGAGDDVAQ